MKRESVIDAIDKIVSKGNNADVRRLSNGEYVVMEVIKRKIT